MRLVILTTQTPHHAYFVREIQARYPITLVLAETRTLRAPFETAHPFETERDDYELRVWFDGTDPGLADMVETEYFETVNGDDGLDRLRGVKPDMVVVFGTGRLSNEVVATCPNGMVNLHGGNPEDYRGLDTPLWAVYHEDFDGLVSTLHRVSPELDSGDIVGQRALTLTRGMKLSELRRINTEACVALTGDALDDFGRGALKSTPQTRKGRYYSFMPSELKNLCVRKFEKYTGDLP